MRCICPFCLQMVNRLVHLPLFPLGVQQCKSVALHLAATQPAVLKDQMSPGISSLAHQWIYHFPNMVGQPSEGLGEDHRGASQSMEKKLFLFASWKKKEWQDLSLDLH